MSAPVRMRVHKYIPDRLFGFCVDDNGDQVFFHLATFHPGVVTSNLFELEPTKP